MILIDILYLIEILLPPFLRGVNMLAYTKAISKPLRTLLSDFYSYFETVKYDLSINGQVMYMELALNNEFDNLLRGIYITDAIKALPTYLFNEIEENEPVYLFNESEGQPPFYLYNTSEVESEADFIVNIPSTVTYDDARIAFIINRYRIASKRWKINII